MPFLSMNQCKPMTTNNSPRDEELTEKLQKRQEKQKEDFDRKGVHPLPPLIVGQKVTTLDYRTGRWTPATVVEKCPEPRSYRIQTPNGSVFRRNRRHMRSLMTPMIHVRFEDEVPSHEGARTPSSQQNHRRDDDRQRRTNTRRQENDTGTNRYQTRSGRVINRPQRLIEQY